MILSPMSGAGLSDSCQPQSALVHQRKAAVHEHTSRPAQPSLPLSHFMSTFQGFYKQGADCYGIFLQCLTVGHWELPSIMTVITGDQWKALSLVLQHGNKTGHFYWISNSKTI